MLEFEAKKNIVVIGSITFPRPMGLGVEYYNIYSNKPKTWENKFTLIKNQIEQGNIDGIILYLATPLFLKSSKLEYRFAWNQLIECIKLTKSLVIVFEENIHENFDYYDYTLEKFLSFEELNKNIIDIENLIEIREKELKSKINSENPKIDSKIKQIIEEDTININDNSEIIDLEYNFQNRKLESQLFKLNAAKERYLDYESRKDEVRSFIDSLLQSGIQLSSFKEKKSIAYRIETFVEEILKDVFFSVYVPKNQLFSEEFEEFLKIFEKYLQKIEGVNFSVDAQSSNRGTKFYFKSKGKNIDSNKFPFAVKRFNDFIELCTINPDAAMEMLKTKFPNPAEALEVIQNFTKKYNRLSVDLKHQQQRLQLLMKQDIENSLLEINIQGTAAIMFDHSNIVKNSIGYFEQGLQMPSFISNSYSPEEFKILEIASKHGEANEIVQVKSNLEILKDNELSLSEKQTAIDNLKSFLLKAGKRALSHAEDIGIKILTTYLDNKINGM